MNEIVGQGSTGNVVTAVCSFLITGLDQLVQGRVIAMAIYFLFFCVLWLGWIMHVWSTISAARWRPER